MTFLIVFFVFSLCLWFFFMWQVEPFVETGFRVLYKHLSHLYRIFAIFHKQQFHIYFLLVSRKSEACILVRHGSLKFYLQTYLSLVGFCSNFFYICVIFHYIVKGEIFYCLLTKIYKYLEAINPVGYFFNTVSWFSIILVWMMLNIYCAWELRSVEHV